MRIVDVQVLDRFKVRLRFNDGVSGVADLGHIAGRGVFQRWLEPNAFEAACITGEGALEWPGGLDLCPDSLYLLVTGKGPEELFPALEPTEARA